MKKMLLFFTLDWKLDIESRASNTRCDLRLYETRQSTNEIKIKVEIKIFIIDLSQYRCKRKQKKRR